jgi:hypothetical protein
MPPDGVYLVTRRRSGGELVQRTKRLPWMPPDGYATLIAHELEESTGANLGNLVALYVGAKLPADEFARVATEEGDG